MSKNYRFDDSKSIEEAIKNAFDKGDFSELKNLGPAVQDAVRGFVFGSKKPDDIPHSTPVDVTPNAPQNTSQTDRTPSAGQPAQGSQYPPPQTIPAQQPAPSWTTGNPRAIKRRIPRGIPQIIIGSLGVVFFTPVTLAFLGYLFTEIDLARIAVGTGLTVGFVILSLGAAFLLVFGISKHGHAKRALQLSGLLQSKKVYDLDDLASRMGCSPRKIKRDLNKMRTSGLFSEIYTDANETCVMWGQDTYEQYLASEEAQQKKMREEASRRQRLENPATADIEYFRSEGEAVIRKIRAANDAISGEEISAKLDALENTTTRIFTYVERYPEKLPDTRKFVNHYLPTTLKLVEKYHQYDRMDFEPENVRQTKAEIERSLDTINVAFNNLLESLFVHDTLDVTTDIKVLENMLEQEGLIGGDTFKINQPGDTQ